MNSAFFYIREFDAGQKEIVLDEENSKHIVQVLRIKAGEKVNLTDGKGNLLTAEIVDAHKKHCAVRVVDSRLTAHDPRKIVVAISLLKNASRFEWFLEKATELGVNEIIPFYCERTEKEKFRADRLQNIVISAMLQSQQCWMPILHQPVSYATLLAQPDVITASQKFIAHCLQDAKRNLTDLVNKTLPSQIILIGPEGDFTREEVELAKQNRFMSVSLGDTRLRAETAGVVASTLLRIV